MSELTHHHSITALAHYSICDSVTLGFSGDRLLIQLMWARATLCRVRLLRLTSSGSALTSAYFGLLRRWMAQCWLRSRLTTRPSHLREHGTHFAARPDQIVLRRAELLQVLADVRSATRVGATISKTPHGCGLSGLRAAWAALRKAGADRGPRHDPPRAKGAAERAEARVHGRMGQAACS